MLFWETPSGNLGTIEETYPSTFVLKATSKYSRNIFYDVISGELPPGLTLDSVTGDITGRAGYSVSRTYTFVVRAYLVFEGTHADRTFSINVVNKYSAPISEIRVDVLGENKLKLLQFVNAYQDRIDRLHTDYIYRPNDPNFGIKEEYSMYIFGGMSVQTNPSLFATLKGALPDDPDAQVYPAQTHFAPLKTIFGDVQYATGRDRQGNPLYDVIYLEVYDPDVYAGGFKNGVEDPVYYTPETNINPQPNRIYPKGLYNWRNAIQKDLELVGEEPLPRWMRSQQVLGEPRTVIGFIPVIELMYVKHGYGKSIVQALAIASNPIKFTENIFDRLTYINRTDINNPQKRWFSYPPGMIRHND